MCRAENIHRPPPDDDDVVLLRFDCHANGDTAVVAVVVMVFLGAVRHTRSRMFLFVTMNLAALVVR